MKNAHQFILLLLVQLFLSSTAAAWDDTNIERVAQASATFVENFNDKNSAVLGPLYTFNGILKLPGALAISGRQNVVNAWQGGFDAGLDFLELTIENLSNIGHRKVLENGTYALTIQTPNGAIVQTGTYSVLWRVPYHPNRSPKIIFDTIDAD